MTRKALRDQLKEQYVNQFIEYLKDTEDVLRVGSNEIAFPVVDAEGNEDFIVLTVKIPTGANKGADPYDGYAMAEEYEMKLKAKADKAVEMQKKKAAKIKRDEEYRRKVAEMKKKKE
jgi:hypothetical protein